MVRPKSQTPKVQINLTIEKEIVKLMKKYAFNKKKSLSQVTEEIYRSLLINEKLQEENPEELKKMLNQALPIIEKMIKENKEAKS
ncbi:MAG: DUF6364 family protein [archaeon]|nr:DUF6364 family protein [archaeon]